jgi:hypothetical protein
MSESLTKLLPPDLRDRLSRIARKKNLEPDTFLSEIVASAVLGTEIVILEAAKHSIHDWGRMSPNDLVDPNTASRRLRVSRSKLAAMRCRGTGPKYVKMGARTVYYRVCDLDDFLNRCVVQSTSQ